MSAGWVWHPWDAVVWFDVATALADPTHLDAGTGAPYARDVCLTEETSAAWLDDGRILLGLSAEAEDPETVEELEASRPGAVRPRPCGIAVVDLARGAYTASVHLGIVPGAMMPVGVDHVVTFCGHPRLWSLRTGELAAAWPELPSGNETSSLLTGAAGPALALDRAGRRFAVATDDAIHVIAFDPPTR